MGRSCPGPGDGPGAETRLSDERGGGRIDRTGRRVPRPRRRRGDRARVRVTEVLRLVASGAGGPKLSKTLLFATATAAVALSPMAARAAEAAVAEVVVTGRSLEETLPMELSRYGSAVEVVTPQEIKDGVFLDVANTLQMLTPGLYVAPGSGPFSYIDLSLQGSRTSDVLWTVDGVRINNRLYNSTTPIDTLPASMIERIEVLKGGQGLFYGTQAAAGVINVVTRGFTDEFGGELTAGGDTHGGVHADGYVRGGAGRLNYVLYASTDQSDGFRPYDVVQPSATDRKRGYMVTTLGGKLQARLAVDLRLTVQYQHTDARLDNLQPRLVAKSYNDRDEEIVSARLDYEPSERLQLYLKGYFHDWDTTYENIQNQPDGTPRVVYPAGTYWGFQDYGVQALARFRLGRGLEYQLGYDFQNFKGRDEVLLIDGKTEQVHAVVAQVRTTEEMSNRARLSAGVRYNHGQGSDTTVWTVTGRYDVTPGLYLEGVVGTSFLLPDAEQLFGIDPCCARGNPDLEAEESRNLNLAVGGTAGALAWRLTGFARRIDNLIGEDYADPAYPEGLYVNGDGTVKVDGVEAAAAARLADGLTLDASYTYARSRDAGSSRQRDRIPRMFAKAQLSYAPADRPFGVSVAANWTGDVYQTVPGFGRLNYGDSVVVDAAAYLYLDGAGRRHRIALRIENLFDEDYATRLNSAQIDGSAARFLYASRGAPRAAHLRYAYAF